MLDVVVVVEEARVAELAVAAEPELVVPAVLPGRVGLEGCTQLLEFGVALLQAGLQSLETLLE